MDRPHSPLPPPSLLLEVRKRSQAEITTSPPSLLPLPAIPQLPSLPSFLSPSPKPSTAYRLGKDSSTSASASPRFSQDNKNNELPPIQPSARQETRLPSLSSVTGPDLLRGGSMDSSAVTPAEAPLRHWPSMNPLTQFYTPSHLQQAAPATFTAVRKSTESPGGSIRTNSISLDDPDVRIAAQALGELRADFVSPPSSVCTPMPSRMHSGTTTPHGHKHDQPEPLLSLLTAVHPSIATTIEGATSAYSASKRYSPCLKAGAEYIEDCLSPVTSTFGTVTKATGVEGGLRYYLKKKATRVRRGKVGGERNEPDSAKRRRVSGTVSSLPQTTETVVISRSGNPLAGDSERRMSIATISTIETLPAYDDMRSPEYHEVETIIQSTKPGEPPLKTRLYMTTSALSVAMSDESLRTLRFCLERLRAVNVHICKSIEDFKTVLEHYDATIAAETLLSSEQGREASEQQRNILTNEIRKLKNDVIQSLQDAIHTVSKYAASALPDNARDLVHNQLTSLPQKFLAVHMPAALGTGSRPAHRQHRHSPSIGVTIDKTLRDGARNTLNLAKEGLEMLSDVGSVLDGTIVTAEEWCQRQGLDRKGSIGPGAGSGHEGLKLTLMPSVPETEKHTAIDLPSHISVSHAAAPRLARRARSWFGQCPTTGRPALTCPRPAEEEDVCETALG